MTFDYREWLKTAEDRLQDLKEERKQIDAEIFKLESGIQAFLPLLGDPLEGPSELGLTDSIRQMFVEAKMSPLASTGIRDELIRRGMKLEQANPLAAIHQILIRLEKSGFIKSVQFQGKTYYRWTGNIGIGDMMRRGFASQLSKQLLESANKDKK